jgi:hypothetical protein
LQVTLQLPAAGASPAASPGAAQRALGALNRAEDAAAGQLQDAPRATGERLHHNFLTVLETVQQHDAHLLAEKELGFVAAYKVGWGCMSTAWLQNTDGVASCGVWQPAAMLSRPTEYVHLLVKWLVTC